MILRDTGLQEEMRRNLNGDNPGWNDDESAVIEFACQRILRLRTRVIAAMLRQRSFFIM
jgi:hypothetical protein